MMRAGALARLSIAVMKKRGAIDADTDVDAVRFEKLAPPIVDQHAVGLERMPDTQAAGIMRAGYFNRPFVVCHRQNRRLARVPHNGETLFNDSAGKYELKNPLQRGVGHATFRIAVREV